MIMHQYPMVQTHLMLLLPYMNMRHYKFYFFLIMMTIIMSWIFFQKKCSDPDLVGHDMSVAFRNSPVENKFITIDHGQECLSGVVHQGTLRYQHPLKHIVVPSMYGLNGELHTSLTYLIEVFLALLDITVLGIHLFESTKIYPNFEDQICSIELFMTSILTILKQIQTLHIHIMSHFSIITHCKPATTTAATLLNPLAVANPLAATHRWRCTR
ncbi:hypothetical protein ACJX0J_019166 [Zea mays]